MSSKTKSRKAWVLIIVGAVIALGSGVTGFVWLNRVPDLHPVSFGEQLEITAAGSATVTIGSTPHRWTLGCICPDGNTPT